MLCDCQHTHDLWRSTDGHQGSFARADRCCLRSLEFVFSHYRRSERKGPAVDVRRLAAHAGFDHRAMNIDGGAGTALSSMETSRVSGSCAMLKPHRQNSAASSDVRKWHIKAAVAGDSAWERELREQALHARFVGRDVRINLAVGSLEVGIRDQAGPAMPRAGLVLEGAVADLALPVEEHGAAQGIARLALVQAGVAALAQGGIRQPL